MLPKWARLLTSNLGVFSFRLRCSHCQPPSRLGKKEKSAQPIQERIGIKDRGSFKRHGRSSHARLFPKHMAAGQNQWYHFGVGAPPILVYFSGDCDVHWGYGILTHGQMTVNNVSHGQFDVFCLIEFYQTPCFCFVDTCWVLLSRGSPKRTCCRQPPTAPSLRGSRDPQGWPAS